MRKPYFAMPRHPNGEYFLPLADDDDIMQFATDEEARAAAANTSLGDVVGFKIFDFREGL